MVGGQRPPLPQGGALRRRHLWKQDASLPQGEALPLPNTDSLSHTERRRDRNSKNLIVRRDAEVQVGEEETVREREREREREEGGSQTESQRVREREVRRRRVYTLWLEARGRIPPRRAKVTLSVLLSLYPSLYASVFLALSLL